MPEAVEPSPLDEDTLDDILYLCRMGDLEELKSALPSLCSRSSPSFSSPSQLVAVAIDPMSGNSTLHMAAANGHTETLRYLLETIGSSPRQAATATAGSTPDLKEVHPLLNRPNDAGNTPLHWAAVNGQLEAVKLLTSVGADASLKNSKGHDAAFEAEGADREEVVDYLLSLERDDGKEGQEAEGESLVQEKPPTDSDGERGMEKEEMEGIEQRPVNGND